MRRFSWMFLATAVIFFASIPMRAQLGVSASFTTSKLSAPNTDRFYGPTFAAYYNMVHLPFLALGPDARVAVLGENATTGVTSGLVGPRLEVHPPLLPLKPYIEGLVGAAHVRSGQGATSTDSTHLAYGAAAGVDLTIFPRIDWRVVDYDYTRVSNAFRTGGSTGQQSISTGIVLRIPIL